MIGKQRHTIDAKNRIFIPAKFREELGTDVVLTQSLTGRCIRVYSYENWKKFEEKLTALPEIEMDDEQFWVFASTERTEVDAQGRIAIPNELKLFAGLTKDIVSIGHPERMEIWDEQAFEERLKNINMDKVRQSLKGKGF